MSGRAVTECVPQPQTHCLEVRQPRTYAAQCSLYQIPNYSNSVTCARSSLVALVTSKLHVQFTTIPARSDILKISNSAPLATLITQNLRPKSNL